MKKQMNIFLLVAGLVLLSTGYSLAQTSYSIDTVHSGVIFKIKHLNVGNVYGRFNDFTGTVLFDEQNLSASKVNVVIKAESIDTANEKRDQHLRSNDFFNTKRFPEITFTSTSIKKSGDGYEVVGKLSMHGVTKEISTKFEIIGQGKDPWGGTRIGGEARFSVNRKEFGITYMPDGLSDNVDIIVALQGVKK